MHMRHWLVLLISGLMLSNVASATMSCCVYTDKSTDKPQSEQMVQMPCHETSDQSESQHNDHNADIFYQCECEHCSQFSQVFDQKPLTQFSISSIYFIDSDKFISSDPGTIYHPPKAVS